MLVILLRLFKNGKELIFYKMNLEVQTYLNF